MASPKTLRHAAASSETKLSPKYHVPSHATAPSSSKASSSSSSNPTVTKVKLRRKGMDHLRAYNDNEINCNNELSSPYYKGLLYQAIAINNEYGSHHKHHHHHHQNNLNSSSNSRVPTTTLPAPPTTPSEGPYYKGLTDFSLDIYGGRHHDDYGCRNIHEVEGAYESSPYFRGLLTDSSFEMANRKLDEGGGVVPISFSSLAFNMIFCLGGKDENSNEFNDQPDLGRQFALPALSPPAPIPLPSPSLPLPPLPPPPLSMFPPQGM